MEININLFKDKIINLVNDISRKNYSNIVSRNENGRVDINDLENVVKEYEKSILPLPKNAFEMAEIYKINENRLDIYIPLWTQEEGRSDLTLSIECSLKNNKTFIEINDIRVL